MSLFASRADFFYDYSPVFCTLKNITAKRALVYQMARRDIVSRYRGSLLGIFWSLVQPLLMLAIYSFVFGHVMNARWPMQTSEVPGQFALILFSGLVLHVLLAECLTRAPNLITGQPNFVKKVVFPLEVLPLVMISSSLFHFLISFTVLLTGVAFIQTVPLTALLMPLVILPFLFMCLGLSWALAALGVYVRDINHVIGLGVTVLLFFSPILYPLEALPGWARSWIMLNPLSFPVQATRDLLLWGKLPSIQCWAIYSGVSVAVALMGLTMFEKMRKGFADVL